MCNINLLIKSDLKRRDEYLNLLICSTATSYNSNSDGDGIYFNHKDKLIKSEHKINLLKFSEEINKSRFILSHQRLATHGRTKRYTQPFKNKRFVLGHNGIMPKFSNGIYSDSFGFFNEFQKEFNINNCVVKSIKAILDKKYLGSYSIFIFDKKKNELFYFKNGLTDINFYASEDEKVLFITTSNYNEQFLNIFLKEKDFSELDIKNYKIYKITSKRKGVNCEIVGKIKERKYKYMMVNPSNNYKQTTITPLKEKDKPSLKEIKKGLGVKKSKKFFNCSLCLNEKTKNYVKDLKQHICDDCLKEEGFNAGQEHKSYIL